MGTPMALEIQYKDDGGYRVLLDGKELKYVAEYEVKKSSTMKGMAELMLKMRVKYPNKPDKTEDRSDDLIKVMDEAVEKKYQKIRETGKVYTGIQEFCQQLRWTNPQIAEYVRKKMMDLAIHNGDLK